MNMTLQTKDNRPTAIPGDAFAYVKYMLLARQARRNGRGDLADLFESAAKAEHLKRAAAEVQLAGRLGSDEDNGSVRAIIPGGR